MLLLKQDKIGGGGGGVDIFQGVDLTWLVLAEIFHFRLSDAFSPKHTFLDMSLNLMKRICSGDEWPVDLPSYSEK